MMASVDGRLVTDRYTPPFDGKNADDVINRYFDVCKLLKGQAEILGRATVHRHFMPKLFRAKNPSPARAPKAFVGKIRKGAIPTIVLDARGKTLYEADKMSDGFIAVLGEGAPKEYLTHLREMGVSYVFAGSDGKNLPKAMDAVGEIFGFKRVLLEGGGIVNGEFLKAGLIDELSLVVYPGIDGLSSAPSIFEYAGKRGELPASGQSLEFVSAEPIGDGVVWLRYKFHRRRSAEAAE